MWKKAVQYLVNPCKIVNYLGERGFLNFLPDKLYLRCKYYAFFGKQLNLQNPQGFNEKNQWLKLYDQNPGYIEMVDKYEVRQYIAGIIGPTYLVPLLGVWDAFEEINFAELPDQFVLKCTHDSGGVFICKDKNNFDRRAAQKKINRCLKRNYYYRSREWPYKYVKPRIIAEKYLADKDGSNLIDYKVACFNGQAKFFFVCLNRTEHGCNIDMYDLDWNPMPFCQTLYPNSGTLTPRPQNFTKMIEIAEKLSRSIPFLRVDFYEPEGQLYMGELTFFHGSGFQVYRPDSYDMLLGSWLQLPQSVKKIE